MSSESRALTPYHTQVVNVEEYAMKLESVVAQVNLIQHVMRSVMKQDEHYGIIPGCKKPSLYKPGAEKLSVTFRLVPKYEIRKNDLGKAHREYEVVCDLIHAPTGQFFGQGVGSCSTMEAKYRYRKAERKCPQCGSETIIKGKAEYGGGWICFAKRGGCGAKFKDGDPDIEQQIVGKLEYEDPADYYNTVLKMAKKRAHIDAVLTATAASDLFTQDVEDLPGSNSPESSEITTAKRGDDLVAEIKAQIGTAMDRRTAYDMIMPVWKEGTALGVKDQLTEILNARYVEIDQQSKKRGRPPKQAEAPPVTEPPVENEMPEFGAPGDAQDDATVCPYTKDPVDPAMCAECQVKTKCEQAIVE